MLKHHASAGGYQYFPAGYNDYGYGYVPNPNAIQGGTSMPPGVGAGVPGLGAGPAGMPAPTARATAGGSGIATGGSGIATGGSGSWGIGGIGGAEGSGAIPKETNMYNSTVSGRVSNK